MPESRAHAKMIMPQRVNAEHIHYSEQGASALLAIVAVVVL